MNKSAYKTWLLGDGMTESSADKYIREIEGIFRELVAERRLGEYDSAPDAITLLGALEGVAEDRHKYLKKYIRYLSTEQEPPTALLGEAVEALLAAFGVRDRGEGFELLLAAIHPEFAHYFSAADRRRLKENADDALTSAHRVLLRQAMREEGARHRLAALLYERAELIFDNRTDMAFASALQALRTLASDAARRWRTVLPETESVEALVSLEKEHFDVFEGKAIELYIADSVLATLCVAAGEKVPWGKERPPMLAALQLMNALTSVGAPEISKKAQDLIALWRDEETRECMRRLIAGLSAAPTEEIDLAVAVALFAAAPEEVRKYTRASSLYTELLRLICRESLSLRAHTDPKVRLEGCEHLLELFTLCTADTEQMLETLLPAALQPTLHRRDVYGNSLCLARLLEDIANCAMQLAEGEQTHYYHTYAALAFGRASAIAEGCGDKEFALRTANGKRDAQERSAKIVTYGGVAEQEYLYDHALPITATTERIAELEGKGRLIDLRGLRQWRGSVICMEECPAHIESSPLILKPRGVDLGGFFNEYYVASLDSEVARRKQHSGTDVQSLIMMMLLQGQRVILSTNMLTDNLRILELADEPAFLELMRRGYILLSFYGGYSTLIELCADQLEKRFEWSSMPFLNFIDASEDPEIRAKRNAAADYLRGKSPYPALSDPQEKRHIALFKERLERFEEALSLAGLCYYYQRGKGKSVGLLRPQLDKFYRQRLTDPAFATAKRLHGIIDSTLLQQERSGAIDQYNRTSYKNCIDQIEMKALDAFAVTGEELGLLTSVTPRQLEQLRDVLSDRHNYLLASRISDFYHNDFREVWFAPPAQSGVSSYKNILRVRESGERVDWKRLLEVLTRMHALILERPTAERLAGRLSASGQQYVADERGKLRIERAGLVMSDGSQVELSLSDEQNATIHIETEREYER